jgi:uncharacterized protein
MFVGSMGADKGVPFMANEAGTKAYVRSLSMSLHEEFKSHGIHVTVLPPPDRDACVGETRFRPCDHVDEADGR